MAQEACAEEEEADEDAEEGEAEEESELPAARTTGATCNTADDYAHRGPGLQAMPYYIYVAHVTRV